MTDLSEVIVAAGVREATKLIETLGADELEVLTAEARVILAAALRVLADRGYTLEEDGASIWSVVYPRQLADAVEHPAEDGPRVPQ